MKNHFTEIVRYNVWANRRIIEILSNQEESLLRKEIVNSFPSLQKTLFHIWDAEVIWFFRISGKSFDYLPTMKIEEPIKENFQKMMEHDQGWVDFLEQQNEEFFNKTVKYRTLGDKDLENSIAQIIQHCMNHSTYHRGQIITLAKQLGIKELMSTDFIFFQNEKENT